MKIEERVEMMKKTVSRSVVAFCLACVMLFGSFGNAQMIAQAKSNIYSDMLMELNRSEGTIYTGEISQFWIGYGTRYKEGTNYTSDERYKAFEKVLNEGSWETSDNAVLGFVKTYKFDENGEQVPVITDSQLVKEWPSPRVIGISAGTAELRFTSPKIKKALVCKITVKDAELWCEDQVFYYNNEYTFMMKGNTSAVAYTSSNPKVATVDAATGVVTALKKGTTTISCEVADGTTYTKKIKVQKPGLSYSKITSYYFTGSIEGHYDQFPIIAKGIDVKKWTTSNSKVVKVNKAGNIGVLEIHGTGKCTVTCVDTSGKKYKCAVTIVGGKPWSGLRNGYLPDIKEVKTHGYYDDINKMQDFGDAVFCIVDYNKQIDLKNGNKKMDNNTARKKAELLLHNRYPTRQIESVAGGDLLIFKSGNQYARLWVECYYAKEVK